MDAATEYLVADFETRSFCDLLAVGSDEYARHPSTEILCCAFSIGTRETLRKAPVWLWHRGNLTGPEFYQFMTSLRDPKVVKVAHNAGFEQAIVRHKLPVGRFTHPREWLCTASLAAALALPRALSAAAHVLGLKEQKDDLGHKIMLKLSKPRRPSKDNLDTYWESPEDLAALYSYCCQDIAVTKELLLRLPPLTATEREVWILDQIINQRGFTVDRELVQTVIAMAKNELDHLAKETHRITRGAIKSTGQLVKVLAWLKDQGVVLPDLKAKTVDDAITTGMATGAAAELLQIRKDASRTSTKKYTAFEARSRGDGRLRENLMYHGAGPGRWAGMGIQPQNFPRGTIKNTDLAAEIVGDADLELVRLIYGSPMETFASCLRSMILPTKGKTLFVGDYAAIEARVVFWLAGHEAGLQAYREGRDLYREMAAVIYNVDLSDVTKDQRFLGKTVVLGASYGLGKARFQASVQQSGFEIGIELADAAIRAYRTTHSPVPALWSKYEKAAIAAVENPGKTYTINFTTWFVKGGFLFCRLPSGRKLAYHNPSVSYEKPSWGGEPRPVVYFWGVNSTTKQWAREHNWGGVWVENVTQAVARDLMAAAMLRIEKTGYDIILSVHDELVAEKADGTGSVKEFEALMAELPPWAEGLPVKVEGWSGSRYGKK